MSEPKIRKHIPRDISRTLLIEAGFKCSVPQCHVQWPTLQKHHIDEDPSNNEIGNLLLMCPTHHQMVSSGHIDRKTCEMLKQLVTEFKKVEISTDQAVRSKLLFSLIAELHANLILFTDISFVKPQENRVYPRFRHIVLDDVLASGALIHDQDKELFTLLYDWSTSLDDVNRRLDISEFRDFARLPQSKIQEIRSKIVSSPGFSSSKELCRKSMVLLLENYGPELGISRDTVMFGKPLQDFLGSQTGNHAEPGIPNPAG